MQKINNVNQRIFVLVNHNFKTCLCFLLFLCVCMLNPLDVSAAKVAPKSLFLKVSKDQTECSLKETGSANNPNAIIIPGKIIRGDRTTVASVHMKWEDFTQTFDYCALSGFETIHKDGSTDFGCEVNYNEGEWVEFSAEISKPTSFVDTTFCNFVCIPAKE